MHIFIGNLPFTATEQDVTKLFETYGNVALVSIKKKSGMNSRGFGFVEMPNHLQAEAAIAGLENKEFMGRALSVSLRRPIIVRTKKNINNAKKTEEDKKLKVTRFTLDDKVPEVKDPKEKHKPYSGRKGPSTWKKRKGTGKAIAWKKKPGGVKKKFKA